MSSASTPPPEIIEKILLNLSVKSLVRFSSVSKTWNSMIFESRFVQEHKSRGGRKMVTMPSPTNELTADASICRISNTPFAIEDSTALIHPPNRGLAPHRRPRLLAYCDELWLVGTDKSLFLWNHSMRSSRYLWRKARMREFVYGLAYDSGADDYKVLKIRRDCLSSGKSELYSLKSDSWEEIIEESARIGKIEKQKRCEFAKGAFHWIVTARSSSERRHTLVSFDLSTRTHREDVLLLTVERGGEGGWMEAAVSTEGELCVSGCELFAFIPRYFWWEMETGTKRNGSDPVSEMHMHVYKSKLHLYFYDGDLLFTEVREKQNLGLYISRKRGPREQITVDGVEIYGGVVYVESLVRLTRNYRTKRKRSSW